MEYFPLKPRTELGIVFHDFSHLLRPLESSHGCCINLCKRKMESGGMRGGKRAKTQIDDEWTELRIGVPEAWTIRKTLEKSDVNSLARLMLPKEAAEKHILAHWDEETVNKARSKGVAVTVYDMDTNVETTLKMKQWGKASPILNDRWLLKFVHRRNLKEGDQIGLFWDKPNSRLVFSVTATRAASSNSTDSASNSVITRSN